MEWLADPALWLGLPTLILLEIVLGVDNLIFIAILADKLPPSRRNAARQIGLGFALLMRLVLLASFFALTRLTAPLFQLLGRGLSGRDLILLGGGAFLLLKATVEIHERLETQTRHHPRPAVYGGFAGAIAQIVALDAVFSLDSILTAVGMTDQLALMIAAVVIAMILMIVASRPLVEFITAHPPLVILCLGFLLMVGFSLVADGLGIHIPKGYLYAAIGFSVLIESFNQISRQNRQRSIARMPQRRRIADAVLRLLGGVPATSAAITDAVDVLVADGEGAEVFAPAEKEMIRGVLGLADRPIGSIMTPRPDVVWVDVDEPNEKILSRIRSSPHAQLLAGRGSIDEVVGIVHKEDFLGLCLDRDPAKIDDVFLSPVAVHEAMSILKTLELFKLTPARMAIVVDDYGTLQGIVTQTDFLEAIAGDLPDP
jgi:predicted tellurium resistance membrane protein TerC